MTTPTTEASYQTPVVTVLGDLRDITLANTGDAGAPKGSIIFVMK